MGVVDLHTTYDATGSTDTIVYENNANGVIPAGDGATTIGLSPWGGALMVGFGVHTGAAAQAYVALNLQSNNIPDPTNKLSDSVNSTPVQTSVVKAKFCQISYIRGSNLVGYGQEAAGVGATFKMDYLASIGNSIQGTVAPPSLPANQNSAPTTGFAEYSFAASGAATAGVYQSTSFAPSNVPPPGTYAILGLRIYAITGAAVVRFQHTDFGGAFPGFPVVSYGTGALTGANQGGNQLTSDSWQGTQFVQLGTFLGVPCCPTFRIQGQGTGLNVQLLDTAADTAQFDLWLYKVA